MTFFLTSFLLAKVTPTHGLKADGFGMSINVSAQVLEYSSRVVVKGASKSNWSDCNSPGNSMVSCFPFRFLIYF